MASVEIKRVRAKRFRQKIETILVAQRAPLPDERKAGADWVFIRANAEFKLFTILVSDLKSDYSQFGAPIAVMNENIEDAATWFRDRRYRRTVGGLGRRPPCDPILYGQA